MPARRRHWRRSRVVVCLVSLATVSHEHEHQHIKHNIAPYL